MVSGCLCLEAAVSAWAGLGSVRWVSLAEYPLASQPPLAVVLITPHPSWLAGYQTSYVNMGA